MSEADLDHNPCPMPPAIVGRLRHLANKLRGYPEWASVASEAARLICHQEIKMGIEASVLTAYKNALTTSNAALATATAADQAKDATIADLTGKLAAAQAGTKDPADVAAEQQAITDLNLNPDGTPKPAAAT